MDMKFLTGNKTLLKIKKEYLKIDFKVLALDLVDYHHLLCNQQKAF